MPTKLSRAAKAEALHALALSYEACGQPARAAVLYREFVAVSKLEQRRHSVIIGLSNLGAALFEIGAFREAEHAFRSAIAEDPSERWTRASSYNLGELLVARGDSTRGLQALENSRTVRSSMDDSRAVGVICAFLAIRAIHLNDFDEAQRLADEAWRLAAHERQERDFIRAAYLQGRASLGRGDQTGASEKLHEALTRARAVNMVEFELQSLIAIAMQLQAQGASAEARARLDDVWEAAERGPYPALQADAFNVLATIEAVEGHRAAAIEAAKSAYKAAWCDGPPYAYHWGLQAAKAQLAALDAAEPGLSPFDESTFEPLPVVDLTLRRER